MLHGLILRFQVASDLQREGELLNFMITPCDVDDRKPLEYKEFLEFTKLQSNMKGGADERFRQTSAWNTSDTDATIILSSIYWELLLHIAYSRKSCASMYKGHWTHSLIYSKVVELTLI